MRQTRATHPSEHARMAKDMAGDPGFEPGHADPESAVLPLDESPVHLAF